MKGLFLLALLLSRVCSALRGHPDLVPLDTLAEALRVLPDDAVASLLKNAGYSGAQLSPSEGNDDDGDNDEDTGDTGHDRELQPQAAPGVNRTVATNGSNEFKANEPDDNNKIAASDATAPPLPSKTQKAPETMEVLTEENGRHCRTIITAMDDADEANLALLDLEQVAAPALNNDKLDCHCDLFECDCRKQCFCQLAGDPFGGPDPGETCPKCPCGEIKMGNEVDPDSPEAEAPATISHEFKCGCFFDGIGGKEVTDKSSMDCDCKVSDCSCARKCKCRMPGPTEKR